MIDSFHPPLRIVSAVSCMDSEAWTPTRCSVPLGPAWMLLKYCPVGCSGRPLCNGSHRRRIGLGYLKDAGGNGLCRIVVQPVERKLEVLLFVL